MRLMTWTILGLFAIAVAARADSPPAATQPTANSSSGDVDATAAQILRQSCDFLAQTKSFTVHAEIWKDEVLPSAHKIQVTRSIDLDVARPDRFHLEAKAHHKGRSIWFDGKTVTVLDRERNVYGIAPASGEIDQALDLLSDKFGITVPLEDLAVSDPYANAMKNVTEGGYFGDEPVLGVPCRHIGFSTDKIDWQLWVADGPQPLPQKMVISYKTEEQMPQFTAIFTKWTLSDRASDMAFQFIPPPGSVEVPLMALPGTISGSTSGPTSKPSGEEKP
jgi:hypothetical protein